MAPAKKGPYRAAQDPKAPVTIVDPFGDNKDLFVPASYTNQLGGFFGRRADQTDFESLAAFFTRYDCGLFFTSQAIEFRMLHPRPVANDLELIVAAKKKTLREIDSFLSDRGSIIDAAGKILYSAKSLSDEKPHLWRLSRLGKNGEEATAQKPYGLAYILELSPNKQLRSYLR